MPSPDISSALAKPVGTALELRVYQGVALNKRAGDAETKLHTAK
jgi:hypothetical protein